MAEKEERKEGNRKENKEKEKGKGKEKEKGKKEKKENVHAYSNPQKEKRIMKVEIVKESDPKVRSRFETERESEADLEGSKGGLEGIEVRGVKGEGSKRALEERAITVSVAQSEAANQEGVSARSYSSASRSFHLSN